MKKNSKVEIREKEVCFKYVVKTLYGSKCLVSEYIFTLSQISQENTCVEAFLIKLQGWRTYNLQKISNAAAFQSILWNF